MNLYESKYPVSNDAKLLRLILPRDSKPKPSAKRKVPSRALDRDFPPAKRVCVAKRDPAQAFVSDFGFGRPPEKRPCAPNTNPFPTFFLPSQQIKAGEGRAKRKLAQSPLRKQDGVSPPAKRPRIVPVCKKRSCEEACPPAKRPCGENICSLTQKFSMLHLGPPGRPPDISGLVHDFSLLHLGPPGRPPDISGLMHHFSLLHLGPPGRPPDTNSSPSLSLPSQQVKSCGENISGLILKFSMLHL